MNSLPFTLNHSILVACLAVIFYPVTLWADQDNSEDQAPEIFASIWQAPRLYENTDNPTIQSFSIVGRYHGQYWASKSEDNSDDGWENRRFYLGFNTQFLQQFTLEVQIAITDDFDPITESLYDAFLKWENSEKNFAVSVGRLDYVYTGMERSTSSKRIKTMERELLVNQIMPGEVVGIYAKGKHAGLSYQTGLFSGSIDDTFTTFEGGFGALLGFAHEVPLFYDKGTLHLDYLYNNGNEENDAFKPYGNIISLWHQGQKGPLAIDVDLTVASGVGEESDVFGLTLLPTYELAHNLIWGGDKLRLAMRYHYASSRDEHGLSFNKRYEQKVASGKGDSYNSYYLGVIYDIYKEQLKLMGGVEYFDMAGVAEDESNSTDGNTTIDGWSFISGVRLYF
jgi:phosphate-selective porin OprO and OprP